MRSEAMVGGVMSRPSPSFSLCAQKLGACLVELSGQLMPPLHSGPDRLLERQG